MMYCSVQGEKVLSENLIQYSVIDRIWIVPPGASEDVITDRRRIYNVTFFRMTKEVQCDCRKFETSGILCKHCIRILDENLVEDLPKKYIVARWRKDKPRKHTRVMVAYHDPGDTDNVKRFNKMMGKFEPLCETAAMVNDQTVHMVIEALSKLQIAVNEYRDKKSQEHVPVVSTLSSAGEDRMISSVRNPAPTATAEPGDTCPPAMDPVIKDPIIKKRKRGRLKGSRHKSLAETGYKKTNKNKKPSPDAGNGVEEDEHALKGKGLGKAGMSKPCKGKAEPAGKGKGKAEPGKGKGEAGTGKGKGNAQTIKGKGNAQTSKVKGKANTSLGKTNQSKGKGIPIKGKANTSSRKLLVKQKRLDELMADA